MTNLPYFNLLLSALEAKDATVEKNFGRHVHWGYWDYPDKASLTVEDYTEAAERLSKTLITLSGMKNGFSVLDVGCGFGGTLALINEQYQNMILKGVNIDDQQLARAREQVKPIGDNQIEFIWADACELPFPSHSFDTVLAVECIFHFQSREQFFKEAHRVLKPGGRLVLSDFTPSRFSPFRWVKQINSRFFGPCKVNYTGNAYRKLAKATGFEATLILDVTRNTMPTYQYLNNLLLKAAGTESILSASWIAWFSTILIKWITRLSLLNYYMLSLIKASV